MPPPVEVALPRYRRVLDSYRVRTAAGLVSVWDGLGSYDEGDVARFAAAVNPLLAGVKDATVAASTAFYALLADLPPPTVTAAAVPVDPRLRAPFTAMWRAFSQGRPYDEAREVGRSVAGATGEDFVTSTARRTGDAFAEVTGRSTRWTRVPSGGACAWCQTVAGQTYQSSLSADFGHDRCNCVAVPSD